MAWLQEHRDELAERHRGQWIAIEGSELAAVADSLPELLERARQAGFPDPFVTAVPSGPLPQYFAG